MRWLRRRWRRVLWGRCLGREVIFLSFYFAFSPLSFWDGSEDDNEYMNADSVAIKRLSGLYSLFSNALRMEISIPVWPVNRQKTSHQRLAKYFAPPIICIVQIFFSRLPAYTLSSPHPTFGLSSRREDYVAPFSKNSFASLILVAK